MDITKGDPASSCGCKVNLFLTCLKFKVCHLIFVAVEARVRQPDVAARPLVVLLEAQESRDLGARDDARAFSVEENIG